MIMSSLVKERVLIDICATATAHNCLTIHGISGADTVASLNGVGKTLLSKLPRREHSPSLKLVM